MDLYFKALPVTPFFPFFWFTEVATVGKEGGTGEEAFDADDETLGAATLYLLIVAFQTGKGAILDDNTSLWTELYLAWQEILSLFFGDVLVETHEVVHLLVGHNDGCVFAFVGLHLELELRIVLLLELAHPGLAGLDEEEIAHYWAIADHTTALLLSYHALIALEGDEGLDVLYFLE